jgi:hypothetical protein
LKNLPEIVNSYAAMIFDKSGERGEDRVVRGEEKKALKIGNLRFDILD